MRKTDITSALRQHTGGGTITATGLARFLGVKDAAYVKRKYLYGLEAISGKYYLITEVAEILKGECK